MVQLVDSYHGTCIIHSMKVKQTICPRCYGEWSHDIEPDTGMPYTCYTCYNTGTVPISPSRSPFDDYVEYAEFQNYLDMADSMYVKKYDESMQYLEDPIY